MRGDSLEADLRLRDFTVNAIAEPLDGGEPLDPLGGLGDLHAGRLRMAGPDAFKDDPLRVLRLVRVAVELELEPEPEAIVAARAQAPRLEQVSPERVFLELQRIVASAQALRGLELMSELGATRVVLPELEAMRGVEQSRFHHRDVYGHTLEVFERTIELTLRGTMRFRANRRAGRGAARAGARAAGGAACGWDDSWAGAALGGSAARCRQAGHALRCACSTGA